MKQLSLRHFVVLLTVVAISPAAHAALSADAISAASGATARTTPDGVVRIGWPRADVEVSVDGLTLHPFAGLGSWAAFKETGNGAIVMGDTVVFQDEINPAIDAAFANGIEITALHNHFIFDTPKVYFMHIGGTGDPRNLAAGVKAMWDAIKEIRAASPQPASRFPGPTVRPGTVNAGPLETILGGTAATSNGVAKFSWPRTGSMHGVDIGGSMGLSTWAAFSGTDDLAAVDGDFIMTANEVQPVLHALRGAGINIVSLHNHMNTEEPAFYFTHFWGKGSAADLANGIKSALAAQAGAN
jgi:hypothetical protein